MWMRHADMRIHGGYLTQVRVYAPHPVYIYIYISYREIVELKERQNVRFAFRMNDRFFLLLSGEAGLGCLENHARAHLSGSGIKGARGTTRYARRPTRGHAHPCEIACTRRGHPTNSLVQACPIIGTGIRVSMRAYLPLPLSRLSTLLPVPLHPPRARARHLHLALGQINEQCQRRLRRRYASRIRNNVSHKIR